MGASTATLQSVAEALGVTISYLLGESAGERPGSALKTRARGEILDAPDAPAGLVDFAKDELLVSALAVTDAEWEALRSMRLPRPTSKTGYVQLLIAVRAVSGGE